MGAIKKQSLNSSLVIYIGFIVGALNMYAFANYFTKEQFGLTRLFTDVSQTFYILASLGAVPLLYKFYPYYRDRLEKKQRDLLSIALGISIVGFVVLVALTILFKGLIVRKFSANSALFVDYFSLVYPMSFFLLLFSVLEAHAWNMHRSTVANFYKELVLRVFWMLIIGLYLVKVLDFHKFIILFCWAYAFIFFGLFIYLARKHEIELTFRLSHVTRRLQNRIVAYNSFVFMGTAFTIIAKSIDTVMIASIKGIGSTGIFSFSTYITNLIEVPQRSIISAAIPVVSQAWKDKDLAKIGSIYRKSSINMLAFSCFLFSCIWLNFDDVFKILHLNTEYLEGKYIVLIIGFKTIIELGTGINSQILATSRYWRVDFISTVLLVVILIPLNYFLLQRYGLNGLAFANLIAYTIFNAMRFAFIWVKFKLQPFTWKTLLALAVVLVAYFVASLVHLDNALLNATARTTIFGLLFAIPFLYFNISEEITGMAHNLYRKIRRA